MGMDDGGALTLSLSGLRLIFVIALDSREQ